MTDHDSAVPVPPEGDVRERIAEIVGEPEHNIRGSVEGNPRTCTTCLRRADRILALLIDSAVPPEASSEAVEGDEERLEAEVQRLASRLATAGDFCGVCEEAFPCAEHGTTYPYGALETPVRGQLEESEKWRKYYGGCVRKLVERVAELESLASGQTPVTREPEAWLVEWTTEGRGEPYFQRRKPGVIHPGKRAVPLYRAQAPSEPSRETSEDVLRAAMNFAVLRIGGRDEVEDFEAQMMDEEATRLAARLARAPSEPSVREAAGWLNWRVEHRPLERSWSVWGGLVMVASGLSQEAARRIVRYHNACADNADYYATDARKQQARAERAEAAVEEGADG